MIAFVDEGMEGLKGHATGPRSYIVRQSWDLNLGLTDPGPVLPVTEICSGLNWLAWPGWPGTGNKALTHRGLHCMVG
jgi:hypothetical protein